MTGGGPRYFTLNEAEELLPILEEKMDAVRRLKRRVDDIIAQWQEKISAYTASKTDVPPISAVDEALTKAQVSFLVSQINQLLETVQRMGCLPKDLDVGLVDFPARIQGKECQLCWKLGEKYIGFWHGITEGYQGRKPLKHA
jgi:hypothetical protein